MGLGEGGGPNNLLPEGACRVLFALFNGQILPLFLSFLATYCAASSFSWTIFLLSDWLYVHGTGTVYMDSAAPERGIGREGRPLRRLEAITFPYVKIALCHVTVRGKTFHWGPELRKEEEQKSDTVYSSTVCALGIQGMGTKITWADFCFHASGA